MFYLLKSTYQRSIVGDVFIDLDQIESIGLFIKQYSDTEKSVFGVRVIMKSDDHWKGVYTTLEEAKTVIKEMIGNKINEADLDEMQPQE